MTSSRGWTQHRVVGVDAARGIALVGMIAVHTVPAITPSGDVSVAFSVAAGRSAALFAVLAGVGLALLTRWDAATPTWVRRRDRVTIAVRALLLALIGLALGELDTPVAVILVSYGILFVLALPFLGLGARALALWSAGVVVVVPVLSHVVRPSLPAPSNILPSVDYLDQGVRVVVSELLLTGYYPALPWMAYVLAGLAVGRLDLRSTAVATRLLAFGATLAVGSWAVSRVLLANRGSEALLAESPTLFGLALDDALTVGVLGVGTTPTGSWWWLAVDAAHTSTPLDLAGTIGTSLVVLGVCLLVVRSPWTLVVPLLALGGMPLSVYSAHVVLLATALPRTTDDAAILQVLVLMTAATMWRALVGQGPLEWATQRLSRGVAGALVRPGASSSRPERADLG